MSSPRPILENISDTARWVAMYRALESDRPDSHFHDPYARLLAGERGEAMARKLPGFRYASWPIVVRTCLFDELILRCVEREGADLVLNLAAGLDTRPYRLPLPPSLSWVEVDLPEILDYKDAKLKEEKAHCRREVVKLDLKDVAARRSLFSRLGEASKKGVVLSEGLLVYLSSEEVGALAKDLHDQKILRWWIIDLASPMLLKRLQKTYGSSLAGAQARMQFAPEEGTEFFRRHGWREAEFRSTWEESYRLKRQMPFAWVFRLLSHLATPGRREMFRKMGANVLLERID